MSGSLMFVYGPMRVYVCTQMEGEGEMPKGGRTERPAAAGRPLRFSKEPTLLSQTANVRSVGSHPEFPPLPPFLEPV